MDDSLDVGGRLSYFVPVSGTVATVGAGIGVTGRFFDRNVALGTQDRRDTRFDGTLHLLLEDIVGDNVDLRVDYRFEYNDSNDPTEDFTNHVVGSRIVWKF